MGSDTSLWGTYAVIDPMKIEEFTWELQQEWMRLCRDVNEPDVTRAKNQLKAALAFASDARCSHTDAASPPSNSTNRSRASPSTRCALQPTSTSTTSARPLLRTGHAKTSRTTTACATT